MSRLALRRRVVQMNRGKVGKCKHRFLVAYSQVFFSNFFSEGSGSGAAARLCVYIKNPARRPHLHIAPLLSVLCFNLPTKQTGRRLDGSSGMVVEPEFDGTLFIIIPPDPPFPSVCCDQAPPGRASLLRPSPGPDGASDGGIHAARP